MGLAPALGREMTLDDTLRPALLADQAGQRGSNKKATGDCHSSNSCERDRPFYRLANFSANQFPLAINCSNNLAVERRIRGFAHRPCVAQKRHDQGARTSEKTRSAC